MQLEVEMEGGKRASPLLETGRYSGMCTWGAFSWNCCYLLLANLKVWLGSTSPFEGLLVENQHPRSLP